MLELRPLAIIALLTTLPPASANANIIATYAFSRHEGGASAVFDSLPVPGFIHETALSAAAGTADSPYNYAGVFSDIIISAETVGSVFQADQSQPDFARIRGLLTNSAVDEVSFAGDMVLEHSVGWRLDGYDLDMLTLTIDFAVFSSPGQDANGDGIWTDYSYGMTYRAYGRCLDFNVCRPFDPPVVLPPPVTPEVPEPGALSLLGLSVLGLALRRRQSHA